jgi:hypothetical protein
VRRERRVPSLLLALATAVTLLCLSAYQVTGETAATKLLGRLFGSMIEIDRWLPAHHEDLQSLARERQRGVVVLEDLPIQVQLRGEDVLTMSQGDLKQLIRDQAGRSLYHHGMDAFASNGSLSLNQPVRWTVLLLDRDAHRFWRAALVASAAFSGLLAVLVALSTVGNPLRVLSVAVGIGAFLALLVSSVAWMLMMLGAEAASSLLDREIALIFRDAAGLAFRNTLAVLAVAIAFWLAARIAGGHRGYERDAWPSALDEAG